MSAAPGLRTQLLLGLTVVFLVASLSAGGITYWAARRQQLDERLAQVGLLAEGVSRLVSAAMTAGQPQSRLPPLVNELGAGPIIRELCVVDGSGRLLAGSWPGPTVAQQLRRAAASGLQQISLAEQPFPRWVVMSPLRLEGRKGAILFETRLGLGESWPKLFWLLIGFDTVLIVAFMAFVLTRYVVGPLRAMQRAALRVADGDLEVRLESSGAMELASLADSFNRMTVSVQEQLGRLARQQRELEASREHLIRSEKLASVGRLAAGVAHEVGNPLQSIIGFIDVLLNDGGLAGEESRDFLERTRHEAQRIHQIIRDLLDFARPIEDAVEAVSLEAVVDQSLQLVGPQRRLKDVTVERSGLAGLPQVSASGPRLVQILVNILLNAADAMQASGTIYIDGKSDDGSGRVELRIANSGPPIPAELRGRIFDPFFTTKEPGHGTGLGLSVAQSIAESYGGRLMLLDEPRTTFALLLQPWREPGIE